MTYLLTCQGGLLRHGEPAGTFRHAPVLAPGAPLRVLERDFSPAAHYQRFLTRAAPGETWPLDSGPLKGFEAVHAADGTLSLTRHRLALTAAPNGALSLVAKSDAPSQRFLPLAETDLARLRIILGNRWLNEEDGALLGRPALLPEADFTLRLGETRFDLRQQLPFDETSAPLTVTLLLDGWRPRLYRLFRPLIYYTAFNSAATMEQLRLSLASLTRHGRYQGHVTLLTDLKPGLVAALAPDFPLDRLSVRNLVAADRLAAIAARSAILDHPEALRHQPVVYVDTDTIFDSDITPMLAAIARSDRILALSESFSPLRTAESVGAKLFAEDDVDPGTGKGFNAGVLGIPNLHAHGAMLRLIRRIVMTRAAMNGRNSWTWIDQPSTNYVAHRLGGFEAETMTRFVRHGFPKTLADPEGARGLVHVWPPRGGQQKVAAMRAYLDALDAKAKAG